MAEYNLDSSLFSWNLPILTANENYRKKFYPQWNMSIFTTVNQIPSNITKVNKGAKKGDP